MKKALALVGLLAGASALSAQVTTILDDFSGNLSNWSSTIILNNGTAAFNTAALNISGGTLNYVTSTYDTNGIEQAAHVFSGRSLAVGEELQLSLSSDIVGSQDIGLYVGITPTTAFAAGGSTRASYITIYKRFDEEVFSRGFGGTTEYALARTNAANATTTLFISRTDTSIFEAGYYTSLGDRIILTTRDDATNTAVAIGLYTDVRAAGTLGSVDNFAIFDATATPIPEPSAFAALAGLAGLGAAALRRRRRA